MQSPENHDAAFVRYLEGLTRPENPQGRAVLAAMRRGLRRQPGEAAEMFPHVLPKIGHLQQHYDEGVRRRHEEAYFLVASLFAMHPVPWRGKPAGTFGASMARVGTRGREESIQRRFVALLSSHPEELPEHLRHAVSLCASSKNTVPINWLRLLQDLPHWDAVNRSVQLKWARDFWRRQDDGEANPAAREEE